MELGEILWGKTDGLCGKLNGDPYDDFNDKDGNPVDTIQDFEAAWRRGECEARSERYSDKADDYRMA